MKPTEQWVVGAIVTRGGGEPQAFLQRRSSDRHLFANCWDVVGGHVEHGESIVEALEREVREETGWALNSIDANVALTTWTADDVLRHEVIYAVTVNGDLDEPQLETTKCSEHRWVDESGAGCLHENRDGGNGFLYAATVTALRFRESVSA